MNGQLFVPVQLVATDNSLTQDDIGKYGQLRLAKRHFWN